MAVSLQARPSLSPGTLGLPSLSSSKSHSSQGQLLVCPSSCLKQSKKGRQVLSISKRSEHRYQGVVVATGRKGGSGSGRAKAVETPSAAVVGEASTAVAEPSKPHVLANHETNEATESSSAIGNGPAVSLDLKGSGLEVDTMAEADLKENGFRSTRRTKLVCTVGPASCSPEHLESLAIGGMNVARLNMCHGSHEWHRQVIRSIKKLNQEKGFSMAVMMDTEGSEVHMGDIGEPRKAEDGESWTFTVRASKDEKTIQVNYDGFVDDVMNGDEIVVDGGMVRFIIKSRSGPDVVARCIDPGILLSRANLTFWRQGNLIRERNSMLPTISAKDWIDIDFGISEGVDFIAVSFVKTPDILKHLRSYIESRARDRKVNIIAKIESRDSLKNLEEIIAVSDGAMVARGDLGAQVPLEQVPSIQKDIVHLCRSLNKPVIVASQLLESMIEYPTPTRAEVADISEAVRQRADALMLSGESAVGRYPEKALGVLRVVSQRIERWCREEKHHENMRLPELSTVLNERISEQICNSAALMANRLEADAIFVYTRRGKMASLLSRNRPDCPIFAFTDNPSIRQRLNLYWGLIPFRLDFSEDMEMNLQRTFALLLKRGMMKSGEVVIVVSDISQVKEADLMQSIQIRKLPSLDSL